VIKVYKAEADAGLGDVIQANASLAYLTKPKLLTEPFDISKDALENIKKATASINDPDLHYLVSILVSTGWNYNDDVFLPDEVWSARRTPEDKPFNYGHDFNDIIGHITNTFVLNDKMLVIEDNAKFEDLPESFHIATGAVIYKKNPDKDKQERIDKIIAEIAKDKWFVSMEALFTDFAYAVINQEDNKSTLISRNDETSFLTKALRAYGGEGVYDKYKIGRAIKNIVFSGKGLVEEPANPKSIIFTETKNFSGTKANIFVIDRSLGYLNNETNKRENKEMSKELELEKQRDEYKNKAEAALKDLDFSKTELSKVQTDQKNLSALLASTQEDLKKEKDSVADLNKKVDELDKQLAEAKKKVADLEGEKRTAARQSQLKTVLKVDEAKAVELEKSFATLSDEAFEANLKVLAENVAAASKKVVPDPDVVNQTQAKVDDPNTSRVSESEEAINEVRKAIAARFSTEKKKK
jgi:hypothetical protein